MLSLDPISPSSTTCFDSCQQSLTQLWSNLPMNTSTRSLMMFSEDSKFMQALRSGVIDNKYFEVRVVPLHPFESIPLPLHAFEVIP